MAPNAFLRGDQWLVQTVRAGKQRGETTARQISVLTLIILLGIYVRIIIRKSGIKTARGAWLTGSIWVGLTVLFEFGLGLFVSRLSVQELLADYNVMEGRLWPLVLLSLLALPVLFYRSVIQKKN